MDPEIVPELQGVLRDANAPRLLVLELADALLDLANWVDTGEVEAGREYEAALTTIELLCQRAMRDSQQLERMEREQREAAARAPRARGARRAPRRRVSGALVERRGKLSPDGLGRVCDLCDRPATVVERCPDGRAGCDAHSPFERVYR